MTSLYDVPSAMHSSRDYWTEVKKIHKNKFTIQNRVDDKTGSVDIANAFADQYSMLYSSVPSEPTCLSELLMRIDTSCAMFVNTTISVPRFLMLLKDCVLASQTVLIIYTQTILNMAQVIFSIVFQLLLIVCYVMDMHLPVFCMLLLYQFPRMLN